MSIKNNFLAALREAINEGGKVLEELARKIDAETTAFKGEAYTQAYQYGYDSAKHEDKDNEAFLKKVKADGDFWSTAYNEGFDNGYSLGYGDGWNDGRNGRDRAL